MYRLGKGVLAQKQSMRLCTLVWGLFGLYLQTQRAATETTDGAPI